MCILVLLSTLLVSNMLYFHARCGNLLFRGSCSPSFLVLLLLALLGTCLFVVSSVVRPYLLLLFRFFLVFGSLRARRVVGLLPSHLLILSHTFALFLGIVMGYAPWRPSVVCAVD